MSDELRVLQLEDEPADAEVALRELKRAGLAFRVDAREPFIHALRQFNPDIILADYQLPSFDGQAALAIAREHAPDVPFIFVSGAMGEERAIESLHRGAADYVLKDHLGKLALAVTPCSR
ncbi:response regulator [Aromatoleum sp.]|uniref:response regulator n=1 Tax=Aromatoleum sp. TaxID=2307007 RepID=UPI002FC62BFF